MRTREFRRWKREIKIKKRQAAALSAGLPGGDSTRSKKLQAAIVGDKPGLFAKHDYGVITDGTSQKTNVKKCQASYRHKGGYGQAKQYTAHDKRELAKADYL